jgi:hypothetical protein
MQNSDGMQKKIKNACGVNDTEYKFEFAKIFEFFKMHAVTLTPHAQKFFRTTSKTAMVCKQIKNACGVNDTACKI